MTFIATGIYTVYRKTEVVTDRGDYEDNTSKKAVAHGVRASVLETSRRVFDYTESTTGLVRYFGGRFRPGVDVRTGDIVVNDKTGEEYVVEDAIHGTSPVHRPDVRVSLSSTASN